MPEDGFLLALMKRIRRVDLGTKHPDLKYEPEEDWNRLSQRQLWRYERLAKEVARLIEWRLANPGMPSLPPVEWVP